MYFLASMITYPATYGEAVPADFEIPASINPLVAENFDVLNTRIDELLGASSSEPVEPVEPVVSNTDPVVEGEIAELGQDEVAVIDLLSNDSDADGDPLSVVSADGAAFGTVLIVDGQAIYTPDAGYVGPDEFTYVVTDGQGGFIEGVVTVQVSATNVDPEPTPVPVEPEPVVVPAPAPEPEPEPEPVEPGSVGFSARFFSVSEDTSNLSEVDFNGEPTSVGFVDALQYIEVNESFVEGGGTDFFASQYETVLNVTDPGVHQIFLLADDYARVILDGDVILDSSDIEPGNLMSVSLDFDAGSYDLHVQYIEVQGEQTLNLDWAGPSTDDDIVPMVGVFPSKAPVTDIAAPVVIAEEEVVVDDIPVAEPVIVEPVVADPVVAEPAVDPIVAEPVVDPVVEIPKEETSEDDLGEEPQVEAPATPVGLLMPAGETEFNVVSVAASATSLDDVDFAGAANTGQTTNGISLASTDGALVEGGPNDGGLQFSTQISVETAGLYEIGLAADDYAVVNISGLPVVGAEPSDDGETQFNSIFLIAGNHSVQVQYLDVGGAQSLDVSWAGPDTNGEPLPIGDLPSQDAVASLFSDDVSARSDEEAFAISMSEAEQSEQDVSFVF